MGEAVARCAVVRDRFADSVLLLAASRAMLETDGVEWATAVMATPANLGVLDSEGFDDPNLGSASAHDLVLAVRAASADACAAGLERGQARLVAEHARPGLGPGGGGGPVPTIEEAVAAAPGSNVAIVSVTGEYAALAAHHALSAGLHVLLFSDHVAVEEEIELKERAARLGRLVMGPGAGTAILAGTGLGFANAVGRGRVGVVAAAGTGAQEVTCLLDRWGAGVSHCIGVGGRDLSAAVGGRMARLAVAALDADPATEAILLVSKPPAEAVARALLGVRRRTPLVATVLGVAPDLAVAPGVELAGTLEQGALASLDRLGLPRPDPADGLVRVAEAACRRVAPEAVAVRGLFSGGTLGYEAQLILARHAGVVHSNTPIREGWGLPAPPAAHLCLDLGEEEFTQGRPHPMIDPQARLELIERHAADPATAVLLLDVVLGYGSHPDPAGLLAPVCARALAAPHRPQVVAYVLGSRSDPQDGTAQRRRLQEAGCIVPPTAARAALVAAAIALRRPELAAAPA